MTTKALQLKADRSVLAFILANKKIKIKKNEMEDESLNHVISVLVV